MVISTDSYFDALIYEFRIPTLPFSSYTIYHTKHLHVTKKIESTRDIKFITHFVSCAEYLMK